LPRILTLRIPFINSYLMKKILLLLIAPCVFVQYSIAQKNIYHKGWIDFNKNGKMDVFEDPPQRSPHPIF